MHTYIISAPHLKVEPTHVRYTRWRFQSPSSQNIINAHAQRSGVSQAYDVSEIERIERLADIPLLSIRLEISFL